MPSEIITLIAALGGTVVGGFINYFSSRSMKTREWQLSLTKERIAAKQSLYSEFLVSSQRLMVKSIQEPTNTLCDLDVMSNEFARIEIIGSDTVVQTARQICDCILVAHRPEKDDKKHDYFKLKQEFIVAAKDELSMLERT